MKFRLILALICLLLIVQTVSAENRVTNGDFETGDFTGWSHNNNPSSNVVVQITSDAHNGSYAAKLQSYKPSSTFYGPYAQLWQTVDLTDVDEISFYYKFSKSSSDASGSLEFYIDSDKKYEGTSGGWTQVAVNVSDLTGNHTIKFEVGVEGPSPLSCSATAIVDDVVAEAEAGNGSGNATEEDPVNVTEENTSWVVSFKVYRCFKPVTNVSVVVSYNGNVTGSGYTDETGSVAFRLDKLKSYVINVNNSEKVVTVQPIENNYVITLPCNLSQEWETATYNVTTGSYAWDLLTTAQNLSSQLSPSARGFLSGLVAWLAMYGVSAVGVNAAPVGVIALVGLAVVGLADWVAVLLCCVFMVAMYVLRRGIG